MIFKINRKICAVALILALIITGTTIFYQYKKTSAVSAPAVLYKGNIVVPILMYHEIKPSKSGKDAITPAEFESDLKFLKDNNYTAITMTELIDYVSGKGKLPEKPVIISFDDGYYNNYVCTFPLIKKYNTKIVLSIIGKSIDDFTCDPAKNIDYSHFSWSQLNEMLDSGLVEVQNHTYNMHHNTKNRYGCAKKRGESQEDYEKALSYDLQKLQDEVKLFTGKTPNTFTYPYGKVSDESVPIIKKLGFRATLSCDYGVNIITHDPESLYGLKRICRVHGTSAQKSIAGGMKTLKWIKNK